MSAYHWSAVQVLGHAVSAFPGGCPLRPLDMGLHSHPVQIVDVVFHEQSGYLTWPDKGLVYGRAGQVVGTECADGYVRLGGSRRDRVVGYQYAHRVIWEAVHGAIPKGLEIDHLNGRKADNRVSNLEAVSRSVNVRRAIANGLVPLGDARQDVKLTEELVRQIRKAGNSKTVRQWARELGVDPATIRSARDGTTWRHVACRGRPRGGLSTTFGGHHPSKSRRRPK